VKIFVFKTSKPDSRAERGYLVSVFDVKHIKSFPPKTDPPWAEKKYFPK